MPDEFGLGGGLVVVFEDERDDLGEVVLAARRLHGDDAPVPVLA